MRELHELGTLIAGLPALASGAPGLRALQLVLPMPDGFGSFVGMDLGWRMDRALCGAGSGHCPA